MKNFWNKKILGFIDNLIIHYYIGAILVKLSEIETWVISPLCQLLFITNEPEKEKRFATTLGTYPWGAQIRFLKGENSKYSNSRYQLESRLDLFKQNSKYQEIIKELDELLDLRNKFVHAKYFMSYDGSDNKRLIFKSFYLDKDDVSHVVEYTHKTIRDEYKRLSQKYKTLRRLYGKLTIETFH